MTEQEQKASYIKELGKMIKQLEEFLDANENYQKDTKFINNLQALRDTYESLEEN